MLKVGITGGIGSGKSTITKVFQSLGVPVFDADIVAKELMNHDPAIKKALVENFGQQVFKDNILNRQYLSQEVFRNSASLKKLNEITHPATIQAAEEWMQQQKATYVIKEAALLFEANTASALDFIIGVFAPLELRIERVQKRDHMTREAVLERINKQMNETDKMNLCDIVLTNDNQQLLLPQILDLHQQFLCREINKS